MGGRLNSGELPPNIVRCMGAADRQEAGVMTPDEVQQAYDDAAERTLQRLCESELSRQDIEYLHLSYRAREKPGWPDLSFTVPRMMSGYVFGVSCAVELKSATGKLSKEQENCLERLRRNGVRIAVIRSFDSFKGFIHKARAATGA